MQETEEICPVCSVEIENGAKVNFSCGPSGTRAKLWARVCQYAQNPDCINQCEEKIGAVAERDFYGLRPGA